jgi:hypothetical protein
MAAYTLSHNQGGRFYAVQLEIVGSDGPGEMGQLDSDPRNARVGDIITCEHGVYKVRPGGRQILIGDALASPCHLKVEKVENL